jgi:hypothetical protein
MIHKIHKNNDRLIISYIVNNIVAKSIICARKITDNIGLSLSKNIGKRMPGYRMRS